MGRTDLGAPARRRTALAGIRFPLVPIWPAVILTLLVVVASVVGLIVQDERSERIAVAVTVGVVGLLVWHLASAHRKAALEARLRESETRYRLLIEQIPTVTYIELPDGDPPQWTLLYISPQIEDLLGYTPAEWAKGNHDFWDSIVHPDDRDWVSEEDDRTERTGDPFHCVYRLTHRDGRTIWVRDEAVLIRDDAGQPLYWQGVMLDVTAQKAVEAELQASEARFRAVFETAATGIAIVDLEGRLVSANPALHALLGYEEGELRGKHARELRHPDSPADAERHRALIAGELTHYRMERAYLRRDGGIVWGQVTISLVRDESGQPKYVLGMVEDVTERRSAEEALAAERDLLRTLMDSLPDPIFFKDRDSRFVRINRASADLIGLDDPAQAVGKTDFDFGPEDDVSVGYIADDQHVMATGQPLVNRLESDGSAGEPRWLLTSKVPVFDREGNIAGVLGSARDITEQERAKEALRRSEAEFRLVFASNPHPMWIYDQETLAFLEVNDAAVANYGYTRDEFLGMSIASIEVAEGLDGLEQAVESRHRTNDGHVINVEITSHALEFRGRPAVLIVAQDVTERKALETQLAHQALHDPLTGLPNRALFLDRLGHALQRAQGRPNSIAVLFLDLDDFKVVNDTLGHEAGDRLLVAVADRLRRCLRPGDTVARLGGDEFTLLLEGVTGGAFAAEVAERVITSLSAPFVVDAHEVFAVPSIGIALDAQGNGRPQELLRAADVAMYAAKRQGKGRFAIFDPAMDLHAWQRLALEAELRRAIADGQLRVHYQPLVALDTGRIAEMEALVRWEHPDHGLLFPAEFISVAEETGLIVPLGAWVMAESCRQLQKWQEAIPREPPLIIGVNLSARQFQQPTLVAEVTNVLRETGLEPHSLKLEITETAALADDAITVATLLALKELGVQLAIDDFGTGYAGISYLQRCPVDIVKIDRSYVAGLGKDIADSAMVRAVITFAKTLGLMVTAEGVETAAQLAELRDLGCDRGQGFLFARPEPADKIYELLLADHNWSTTISTPTMESAAD